MERGGRLPFMKERANPVSAIRSDPAIRTGAAQPVRIEQDPTGLHHPMVSWFWLRAHAQSGVSSRVWRNSRQSQDRRRTRV